MHMVCAGLRHTQCQTEHRLQWNGKSCVGRAARAVDMLCTERWLSNCVSLYDPPARNQAYANAMH
jgi:hypothetical protein